jgi:putative Ca2+/H+ antiporter (TMEM165/GDT1 family)
VEEELVGKKGDNDVGDEEAAGNGGDSQGKDRAAKQSSAATKILTQAFTLTFLAEWGDRSQV